MKEQRVEKVDAKRRKLLPATITTVSDAETCSKSLDRAENNAALTEPSDDHGQATIKEESASEDVDADKKMPAVQQDDQSQNTQELEASALCAQDMDEEPISGDVSGEEVDEVPKSKYRVRQRVFAKDLETGLLYESTIRRCIFGIQYQRQLNLSTVKSEKEVQAFFDQEPEPVWHYFIHYHGWNVKWDRWVPEDCLFDPTDSTRRFAKRMSNEVTKIRAQMRKRGGENGKANQVRVAEELQKRMLQLERQHRLEEKRMELAAQGVAMDAANSEEEELLLTTKKATTRRHGRWTSSAMEKEIKMRGRHLQGRRKQVHNEMLVLPFPLKKVLVEDWEIVTQCGMFASVPAQVTIQEALEKYKEMKIQQEQDEEPQQQQELLQKDSTAETKKQGKHEEWDEMVEGIMLLFDQGVPTRLLYGPELIQYDAMESQEELQGRRHANIYGCEHLLRLFVRLPTLLTQEFPESFLREILPKLNDLIRFLQKEQSLFFAQKYRKPNSLERHLQTIQAP